MVMARDQDAEERSMRDVDLGHSKEDEETDDDEEDDQKCSVETSEDGQSDDDDGDVDDAEDDEDVPEVVRRATSSIHQVDDATDEVNHENVIPEAGSDSVVETLEEENGDVVHRNFKRRRLLRRRDCKQAQNTTWDNLISMQDGDWDEESDDDDWSPLGAIKLPLNWFCTNCTMPNSDKLLLCGTCGENRMSGILIEGHLASSTTPIQSTPACVPLHSTAHGKVDSTKSGGTVIGFDERMLLHEETSMRLFPHPERSDRLRAIVAGLAAEGLFPGRCSRRPTREVTRAELEQVHSQEHVDAVEVTCNEELSYFTTDTYANKDSSLAARVAAGISADLATAIVKGEAQNGFALVRPPGHHAEEVRVMGFCLHNNASVAAKAAQAAGAKKVLIVDWDVHHGNGTQDIFEEDPSVLYVSLHRHDGGSFYPGTGAATEVGSGKGEGSSVNIPWICSGIGDNDYIFAFLHIVLPIARQFSPDITIISAGFDAARGDPLGGCEVTPSGYAHMTSMLNSLSGGKVLVILEGG